MKNIIIRINDVTDIDTSKVSVYDLNNRYVDVHGNMYGLRYNKALRRMEVLKILRTHEKNAGSYQQKILMKKKETGEAPTGNYIALNHREEPLETPGILFNPEAFIEKTLELAHTHRDRIKGIIMNIRNSNIIPKENKTESNQMEDIFRNLDIDAIQAADNLINYQKELINYPRSNSYYQAKMDDRGREIFETLASTNKKVSRFIYLSEMLDNFRILYKNIERIVKTLKAFLEEFNIDEIKWLTIHEKQSYKDSLISINNTIQEISGLHDDLKRLDDYTFNLDNFS